MNEKVASKHIVKALAKLERGAQRYGWTKKMERKYNNIDANLTKMMLASERECVSKTSSTSKWSTNLEVATRAIRYWNIRIFKHKKQKGSENILQQELEAGKVLGNTHSVAEATTQRAEAWRNLIKILNNHEGERLKDLKEKLQDSLIEGNIQKVTEYKQLIEKEKGKEKWREIKEH